MRDDIRELLIREEKLYSKKKLLLENILATEAEILFALKTGRSDELAGPLAEDSRRMDEIDAIDCSLADLDRQLAGKIGVSPSDLASRLAGDPGHPLPAIANARTAIERILGEIALKRKETIALLETSTAETLEQIQDLESLRRVRRFELPRKQS